MWFLCKHFKTTPDDSVITDMDPVLKIWMYNNWIQDQQDSIDLAKDHAYLLGSFSNPEAVKKLLDGATFKATNDDFDMTAEKLRSGEFDDHKKNKRKKRKLKS